MKNMIFIAIIVIVGYFFIKKSDIYDKFSNVFEPQITINDLKNSPSVFADSLVELRNLRVIETQSVMNYSKSIIADETDQEIILLSNRPFRRNENVSKIRGRFTVVYQDKAGKGCELFISEDLQPFNDLMEIIRQSIQF